MSQRECIVCDKSFVRHKAFLIHLRSHIENAQSTNARNKGTTTIVVEVKPPVIVEVKSLESSTEITTKIVEINVSATTVTETSDSRTVDISIQRLNPRMFRILSENTYKPVASSESKCVDVISSPDMDAQENTSNSGAAPATLVAGKTNESLESSSVDGTSSPEIEVVKTTSRIVSEVISRRESGTVITETIYESSGSGSADGTSSPRYMSRNKCVVCKNKSFLSQVGIFTHLKNHIGNALNRNARNKGITTIVVEVESPKSSTEIGTKIVQINVSATTITETSQSGNVDITLERLNPRIVRILTENTYKPVASSKSEGVDGTSSAEMDAHENTSNSDAAPATLAVSENSIRNCDNRNDL